MSGRENLLPARWHNSARALPQPVTTPIAELFTAAGVEAAVRAAQAGDSDYKTFCAKIAAAGCVGYIVSLAGRRVAYYGRTAEMHVEYFPGSR